MVGARNNRILLCLTLKRRKKPDEVSPTQIAAIALDGRNFRLKGEFNSDGPIDDEEAIAAGVDPLEEGVLKVTGQTDRS